MQVPRVHVHYSLVHHALNQYSVSPSHVHYGSVCQTSVHTSTAKSRALWVSAPYLNPCMSLCDVHYGLVRPPPFKCLIDVHYGLVRHFDMRVPGTSFKNIIDVHHRLVRHIDMSARTLA